MSELELFWTEEAAEVRLLSGVQDLIGPHGVSNVCRLRGERVLLQERQICGGGLVARALLLPLGLHADGVVGLGGHS